MLIDKLKALYNLPMREAVYIIRNKIAPRRTLPVDRIATSAKLLRPRRPWEFLALYEAILARATGWRPLDFSGRHVLEVGCGPLLGFMPLAVYRGASRCTCIEPQFTPEALTDQRIVEGYFRPLWEILRLVYGTGPDFEAFMAALRETDVQSVPMAEAEPTGQVGIVLSNSCLEHITPLDASLVRLRQCCGPDVRFLHLVNFGNHMGTRDPFKGMYAGPPEKWRAANGSGLNLLRARDVRDLLESAGFACDMTVLDVKTLFTNSPLHAYWSGAYTEAELSVRTALFSSRRADAAS